MHACSVALDVSNSATPWTIACQAPLSMGFSVQELEWVAGPFFREFSWRGGWTRIFCVSCFAEEFTAEPLGKPLLPTGGILYYFTFFFFIWLSVYCVLNGWFSLFCFPDHFFILASHCLYLSFNLGKWIFLFSCLLLIVSSYLLVCFTVICISVDSLS